MEKTGDALGIPSGRIEGDLERFLDYIEERGRETGGWRGQVELKREDIVVERVPAHEVEAGKGAFQEEVIGALNYNLSKDLRELWGAKPALDRMAKTPYQVISELKMSRISKAVRFLRG